MIRKPRGYFIGGLVRGISTAIFGNATRRVQKFLSAHGEDMITSLRLGRTPISGALDATINIISGGKFQEAKEKEGYDKFYHLFLIINNKWRLEKNQNLNIVEYSKSENEDNEDVEAPNISINEFFQNCIKKIGEEDFFGNYSALKQNCQWLILQLLHSNGIHTADKFIHQDVEGVREEVGTTTNTIANEATDIASGIDKIISYISDGHYGFKRGGKIKSLIHYKIKKHRIYR